MAQQESHGFQHWKMQSNAPGIEEPPAEIQQGLGCTDMNIYGRLRAELVPLSLADAKLLPIWGFQAEASF